MQHLFIVILIDWLQEYNASVIVTSPSVPYKGMYRVVNL